MTDGVEISTSSTSTPVSLAVTTKRRSRKTFFGAACWRVAYEAAFSDELLKGSLVISGWARAVWTPLSQAAINIGGRDSSEFEGTLKKIKDFAALDCNM
ncbi:solid-state culture-specific ATP-grasp domain protein [Aspergillus lentulus]|nr:solid-state culture-specific ATP-grasp domain protein [Aspergillus lentulus]